MVDALEWSAIVRAKPNLLLCGEPSFTEAVVSAIETTAGSRIRRLRPPVRQRLAGLNDDVVLLEKVDEYHLADQAYLLEWIEYTDAAVQLIATTDRPLLDLVSRGEFAERLLYRLNTVYVDVGCVEGGVLPRRPEEPARCPPLGLLSGR
jgi:Sigma-54 interaction domain